MMKCNICNKELNSMRGLVFHLKTHNTTSKEYYDKYFKKEDSEGKCLACGNNTSFVNIGIGYRKFCSNKCYLHSDYNKQKTKAWHDTMSQKEKESINQKISKSVKQVWQEATEEEKELYLSGLVNFYENLTEEEKKQKYKNMANTYHSKSYIEKCQIQLKREVSTYERRLALNKLSIEDKIYTQLQNRFPSVKRWYFSESYPFVCDFFIPELNLYIIYLSQISAQMLDKHSVNELNFFRTHNTHRFDKNNKDDLIELEQLKELAQDSVFYSNMVHQWAISDVFKYECAKANQLNYLVFYNLEEFNNWFNSM